MTEYHGSGCPHRLNDARVAYKASNGLTKALYRCMDCGHSIGIPCSLEYYNAHKANMLLVDFAPALKMPEGYTVHAITLEVGAEDDLNPSTRTPL